MRNAVKFKFNSLFMRNFFDYFFVFLIAMRGGVQLTVAVCVALLLTGKTSAFFRCSDRTPEGRITSKSPVENKFQLKISGNPNTYEPGEKYTGKKKKKKNQYSNHGFCNPRTFF